MRTRLLIPALIILLLVPFAARSADQATIDHYIFLLQQPEWDMWGDGVFPDDEMIDTLGAIHDIALADGNDILYRSVIWAMGETGLTVFVPTIIEALDAEPTSACYALGKLSSEDGVFALIGMLDNEDMQVRDAAVWGLGSLPYVSGMETARDDALAALNARLDLEEEEWVLADIEAAVTMIETGIATIEAFEEPVDPL